MYPAGEVHDSFSPSKLARQKPEWVGCTHGVAIRYLESWARPLQTENSPFFGQMGQTYPRERQRLRRKCYLFRYHLGSGAVSSYISAQQLPRSTFSCHVKPSLNLQRRSRARLRLRDSFSFAKEIVVYCLTAMLSLSRFCNILPIDRQIITNAVYIVTLFYLILFSIFNSLYLDTSLGRRPYKPDHYDLTNVAVNPVDCTFPISSYYAKTPRFICYLLLVFTIVIRNHKWLVAGAAASVLTYSGVAAIHLIILFATNNRLNLPKAKWYCEFLPIPGASASFAACAGITDPDGRLSGNIVINVMLGALPTIAWSRTFRRSTSQAILIFWLLLLAVGHTFYSLTISNSRQHFQICPKDYIEPLPIFNFKAPFLDQSWRDSFYSLVSTAQQSSQSPRNSSSLACIYSCFGTTAYIGRETKDIGVWDGNPVQHPVLRDNTAHRRGSIVFWWGYTLLALITLFTSEKKRRLPKGLHKLLFSIEYRQQSQASRWKWKSVTNIAIKEANDAVITTDSSEATTTLVKIHMTVLKVVQLLTQLASVGAFCGTVIVSESQNARTWSVLSQEPFGAVGQWSNLAVVLLVLVAAGVGRIWAGTGAAGSAVMEEEEDWNWRLGCAW